MSAQPPAKKLRVLVAMHEDLVPPDSIEGLSEEELHPIKMEYDVLTTLRGLGHEVRPLGLPDDLTPLRAALDGFQPHLVFNLLTHFHDAGIYDSAVVSWLELKKQRYTGCNPRGLLLANDKELAKKLFSYHRIRAPRFFSIVKGKSVRALPKNLAFPLFVKSTSEHASTGIAQASIVRDLGALNERAAFIHRKVGTAALCEHYIEGRELTIGVLGNARLETSAIFEVFMDNLPTGTPNIFTSRVKWDTAYQKKIGLRTGTAELPAAQSMRISRLAKRIFRALGLSGYARIDMRMDNKDRIWILEANPNPDLCFGEDFAEAFERNGYSYPMLIQKLLNLGLSYRPPWMS